MGFELMIIDDIVAQLLRVELFQHLEKRQIAAIAREAERITFRTGDHIAVDGASADGALLIVGGPATWIGPMNDRDIAEPIECGSLIGEMSMFIDYQFGATVVAAGPVKCLRISREAMHRLMLEDPSLAEALTEKIASRLFDLAEDLRSIDRDLEAASVAGSLSQGLSAHELVTSH
jgi:signal-transduction protein with cAMP-binding, CBS, and nucleotidyltransferase domain